MVYLGLIAIDDKHDKTTHQIEFYLLQVYTIPEGDFATLEAELLCRRCDFHTWAKRKKDEPLVMKYDERGELIKSREVASAIKWFRTLARKLHDNRRV